MAKEKEINIEKEESLKDFAVRERAEKISDEDLKKLQTLVNQINSMQFNVGKLETQKHTVLHNLSMIQDRVSLFQDKLTKDYGTFDVNIADGTINWPKEDGDEK